jgi:hypothetical protein
MSRRLRPLAALGLVALIGLISAGCGSNAPSETGTASSSGSDNGSGSAGAANTAREKAVKFAECMRDNGVSEFPDPDTSGELTIDGVLNGSSLDPSTAAWKQAITACKDLQPPGFTGGGKRNAKEQDAAREFAQCIRDNGVKDFPDPINGEPLVDTNRIPSAATNGGMTILNAAMQTCRKLGAKAMAGRK